MLWSEPEIYRNLEVTQDKLILNSNRSNKVDSGQYPYNNNKNSNKNIEKINDELYKIKKEEKLDSLKNIVEETQFIAIKRKEENKEGSDEMDNKIENEEKNYLDYKNNSPPKATRKLNSPARKKPINNKNLSSTRITAKTNVSEGNRTDAYGNSISKVNKTHKVSFVDTHFNRIQRKNLVHEIKVESYKKYNIDISRKKKNICFKDCNCRIF